MLADSMMSPMTSIMPAVWSRWRACERPIPIDESAMAGQKIGTLARYAAVRMPSVLGLFPEVLAELVEELARGVRPPLELEHERGDPFVVLAELVLARQRVVHAIDALGGQRRVVERRRSDEVPAAARLVKIVIEVRAGRDEAVDVPMLDQVRDDQPHAAGRERAGRAEKDRRVARRASFPRCGAPSRGCVPETTCAPCVVSTSSAESPAVTANGSTGLRRKRDLRRLMRASFYRVSRRETSFRNVKSAVGVSVDACSRGLRDGDVGLVPEADVRARPPQ